MPPRKQIKTRAPSSIESTSHPRPAESAIPSAASSTDGRRTGSATSPVTIDDDDDDDDDDIVLQPPAKRRKVARESKVAPSKKALGSAARSAKRPLWAYPDLGDEGDEQRGGDGRVPFGDSKE